MTIKVLIFSFITISIATIFCRYPSLTDLSLANGEFSKFGNFYNVRCIEKLKLQNMEINNFDWLEYSSTSLVHLKELWLGELKFKLTKSLTKTIIYKTNV